MLLVGSCAAEQWLPYIPVPVDYVATNYVHELPPEPPRPLAAYDLQLVQIPLRSVIGDDMFWHLDWSDDDAWQRAFDVAVDRVRLMLALRCVWNRRSGLLTFVSNFHVPQRNALGRMLPRYDLRNMVYVVERLNEVLAAEVARHTNAYVLDVDELASIFGKKYVQDDSISASNHAALLAPSPYAESDLQRIEPLAPVGEFYEIRSGAFMQSLWHEITAMVRTIRGQDQVKLLIVDLDDTLWRSVLAESGQRNFELIEGWPLGIAEALLYLKMRGVLLAIVSKNDEAFVRGAWDEVFGNRLRLDDFAVTRINWRPKSENVAEVLGAVNLLPASTVFVDDNPRERAEVQDAFPEIRVLGADPYYIRRVLLWSPEPQVASVTAESANRTAMVRSHVERETERASLSRDAFLASLRLEVDVGRVDGIDAPTLPRILELVNKTNQFNTTGRRWSSDDLRAAIATGVRVYYVHARDRYTAYGLIGAAIVDGATVTQVVLSCRAFGLDIEVAALAAVLADLRRRGVSHVAANLIETPVNGPCRDLYERCGFLFDGTRWRTNAAQITVPAHIELRGVESADEAGDALPRRFA